MIGVVTSIGIGKCDQSRDIGPESYLLIRVVIYLHYKHV
jgi:hypothetical protein